MNSSTWIPAAAALVSTVVGGGISGLGKVANIAVPTPPDPRQVMDSRW